jgi:hypothetical protein
MAEKATNVETHRFKLAEELLELRHKYAPYEPRDKEIRALLIQSADEGGGSFKITVEGLGKVSVSAPQPERVTGTCYEVNVKKFRGLPKAEQNALTKRGIVLEVPDKKAAYAGRVYPELFP